MRVLISFLLIFKASVTFADSAQESLDIAGECQVDGHHDATMIDDVHGYFNEKFCVPAVWFDNFFADERIDEELRPGSHIRWQNDYIENEFGESEFTTKLRGSFELPKAKKKLRLEFEGEPESSLRDIVPSSREESETQVGIVYELTRSPRSNLSWKLRLSPSLTMRYRYRLPLSEQLTNQYTYKLFYKDSAFGTSLEIDFTYTFSEQLGLRQATNVGRSEDDEASKWSTGLVLYQRLSEKSALSYESSYNGTTQPEVFATNARIAVRYRRLIYRSWLFFEVAPETTWPRELITDERKKTHALFFRLEVNFINL